jgi:hypothetical protein
VNFIYIDNPFDDALPIALEHENRIFYPTWADNDRVMITLSDAQNFEEPDYVYIWDAATGELLREILVEGVSNEKELFWDEAHQVLMITSWDTLYFYESLTDAAPTLYEHTGNIGGALLDSAATRLIVWTGMDWNRTSSDIRVWQLK